MKNYLKLGFIRRVEDNKVLSHRALFKIILNPFLRYFLNKVIVTNYNNNKNEFVRYGFTKINRDKFPRKSLLEELKFSWNSNSFDFEHIVEFKHWLI